jgi:hypothetical protein
MMAKENIGPPSLSSRFVARSTGVLFVADTSNIFSPKRYYGVIPRLISGRDVLPLSLDVPLAVSTSRVKEKKWWALSLG